MQRMLRDAIVMRAKDPKVQEKCLEEGDDLTLDKAIKIGQNVEISKKSLSAISAQTAIDVQVVKKKTPPRQKSQITCKRCGKLHAMRACPAWGTTCFRCKGKNHWAKFCRSKSTVDEIVEADTNTDDEYFVDVVGLQKQETNNWMLNLQVQNRTVRFKAEITAQFSGAKIFSKLDASSGFWQIQLDEDSSKLCTFITPFGRYRFLRLLFGISSAPEVYHKLVHNLFAEIPGVNTMMDDIIV
ncbi:uncharacterized protein LOC117124312 [Anneissia japonica]|uniref:uncharacterized protein LOC117124312 n=1 Tax=Anneissia japonica TaxID=1529436 RepID=UPI001425A019|nr:uncharacterized protein LOC117124312 [Anneissia japonica]